MSLISVEQTLPGQGYEINPVQVPEVLVLRDSDPSHTFS